LEKFDLMRSLPNITSLRFFLALFVVISHIPDFCKNQGFPYFNASPIFFKGSEAVYMFFALSGFLIIRQLYLEKTATGTISLKQFFLRRILRIFPLYYLVLIFGLFYYRYLLPQLGYPSNTDYDLLSGVMLAVFFLPNVFKVVYEPGGIIQVLWSIGIEEQFYLFIAPLMLLIPSRKVLLFLGLFTVVYFGVFFSDYLPFLQTFYMFFFYFSISGFGSVLFLKSTINPIRNNVMLFGSGVLFVLYFTTSFFSDHLPMPFYHLFSMCLFTVLLCTIIRKPLPLLANRKFEYLGKISYGMYMYHFIVVQIVGFVYLKMVSKMQLADATVIVFFYAFVILGTVITAHLSYNYFEKFFLKLKSRYRPANAELGLKE
jgi:peptidoglycan/LPS O-acetylase OafA/YrhL